MTTPLQAFRQAHRNVRILGVAAILLLGGLTVWLVLRPGRNRVEQKETAVNRKVNNEYVTQLVNSGVATAQAMEGIAALHPYRGGFIGFSRDAFTMEEARAFGDSVGADVLDVSWTAAESEAELTKWLERSIPEALGVTTWAQQNGVPRLVDAPDLLVPQRNYESEGRGRVFDLAQSIRHRTFFRWPKQQVWQNKGWSWTIPPRFDEAQPHSAEGVARVRVGKLWGMIDRAGKEVQPPSFDVIRDPETEHGSYRVSRDGRWGVLAKDGRLVAKPEWDEVQDFIRGFTAVQRGGKWGYVDASGKLVIPCEWDDAWRFSLDGYAIVTRRGLRGFIDRTGRVVVPPVWSGAVNFTPEGIGMVCPTKDGDWGLIDTAGRVLTQQDLTLTQRRSKGLEFGVLQVGHSKERFTELISLDGKPIPGTRIDQGSELRQAPKDAIFRDVPLYEFFGNAVVPLQRPLKMLSLKGEPIREIDASDFQVRDGMALVTTPAGSAFIGDDGEWVMPPRQTQLRPFANGLAAASAKVESAKDQGKPAQGATVWGHIDKKGEWVVKPEWDEVSDFTVSGVARVRLNAKWGLVGPDGKTLLRPEWDEIKQGGVGDKWMIFATGRHVLIRKDALWGMADVSGKILTPPAYEWIALNPYGGLHGAKVRHEERMRYGRRLTVGVWTLIDDNGKQAFEGRTWMDGWGGGFEFENGVVSLYSESGLLVLDRAGREYGHGGSRRIWPMGDSLTVEFESATGYLDASGRDYRIAIAGRDGEAIMKGANTSIDKAESNVRPNWLGDLVPHATPARYGLLDATGRVLVEPTWEDIRIISADWVWFKLGGKCGLADKTGKVVIAAEWDDLEVLPVRSGSVAEDGKNLLVGRGGEPILSPWVRVKKGVKTVILRTNGEPAIPEAMADAEYVDFYGPEHVVITQPSGPDAKLWSLYEPATGKQTKFPGAATFRWNWNSSMHGLVWQLDKDAPENWRLMTKSGQDTGHTQPNEEKPDGWGFTDDRAPLHKADGWTFVGPDGKPVSTDRWDDVREFSEDRAAVNKAGKWGFVGVDGRVVTPITFDEVGQFHRGLASCRIGTLWGYVGSDGKPAIPAIWDAAGDFMTLVGTPASTQQPAPTLDVALVTIHGSRAAIDKSGRLLSDPSYRSLYPSGPTGLRGVTGPDMRLFGVTSLRTGVATLSTYPWKDELPISADRAWRRVKSQSDAESAVGAWRLVDAKGELVGYVKCGGPLTRAERSVDSFAPEMVLAKGADGGLGLLGRDGAQVVPPNFDKIVWVAKGAALVWSRDEGGLIDTSGAWLFKDSEKVRIARFEQGPVPPAGSEISEPLSSRWRRYRHGLVAIEDTPKWGYAHLNR